MKPINLSIDIWLTKVHRDVNPHLHYSHAYIDLTQNGLPNPLGRYSFLRSLRTASTYTYYHLISTTSPLTLTTILYNQSDI